MLEKRNRMSKEGDNKSRKCMAIREMNKDKRDMKDIRYILSI